ncbi:hypothetical protein KC929_01585 [Patescibacteria group bacterium]|nr:hypothetical protein [Patescibacteria group bacterium]
MNDDPQKTEKLSIEQQLNLQQEALAKIYKSVEQTRKIMLWTGIISIAMFVLPLIAVAVLLPKIISTYTSSFNVFTDSSSIQESGRTPSLSESLSNLKELGF